jgi:hypothetical protein
MFTNSLMLQLFVGYLTNATVSLIGVYDVGKRRPRSHLPSSYARIS